jgi:CubicO group peptidase (beta-lactamase class C family)
MRLLIILVLSFWFVVSAYASEVSLAGKPAVRDEGWQVSSLQEAGFDIAKMQTLTYKLINDDHSNAHAVIIEHDGKLIYEQYLEGSDQNWGSDIGRVKYDYNMRHDLRSVSKSVTALLLGIALGDGYQSALSKPIIDYFPKYVEKITPGFEKITLHDVLTMSAGFEWNEMTVPYSNNNNDELQLYSHKDPFEFIFSKPIRNTPGEAWYYNGGTTMLLAGAIQEITGKTFLFYIKESLFDPLGITDFKWRGDGIWQPGLPAAASGLRLRGRDLAKIGSLMLHNGQWNGKQIVSREWVRTSFIRHTEQTNSQWSMEGAYGYSYQWWHGIFGSESGEYTALAGLGYGGQRLFILPKEKLAITIFAGNYGKGNWIMPEQILSEIIAASQR